MNKKNITKEIPWPGDACIVCLGNGKLSLEHIIPKALHGRLVCRFLCEKCNNRFSLITDAGAKSDPDIRSASGVLRTSAPEVYAKIQAGQQYLVHTEAGVLQGVMKHGVIKSSLQKMPDGSSVGPEDKAIASLSSRMREEGIPDHEAKEALLRYKEAPLGATVDMPLQSRWKTKKLAISRAEPDFNQPNASNLLFVKIAYEFAALLVGRAIYAETPELENIRCALNEERENSNVYEVERLIADRSDAIHGIAFEGNFPHARFQIRLFGKVAFRVHLKQIAIQFKPISYTHNLVSGEHWHNHTVDVTLEQDS